MDTIKMELDINKLSDYSAVKLALLNRNWAKKIKTKYKFGSGELFTTDHNNQYQWLLYVYSLIDHDRDMLIIPSIKLLCRGEDIESVIVALFNAKKIKLAKKALKFLTSKKYRYSWIFKVICNTNKYDPLMLKMAKHCSISEIAYAYTSYQCDPLKNLFGRRIEKLLNRATRGHLVVLPRVYCAIYILGRMDLMEQYIRLLPHKLLMDIIITILCTESSEIHTRMSKDKELIKILLNYGQCKCVGGNLLSVARQFKKNAAMKIIADYLHIHSLYGALLSAQN